MKKEPIRILQVVNIMDRAGLENMLINYYRNIDRSKVQFDFLTHRDDKGAYDDEIVRMGGKVYHAPRLLPHNYLKYFKFMKKFFLKHTEYQIIHSHIDTMSSFPLFAAKKAGIPFRISHSHSSKLDKDFKLPIKFIGKMLTPKFANKHFACGKKAGEFLYKKGAFEIINNAVDLNKFKFNEALRRKKRKELKISENTFVIGHVGRYMYIKNQSFLIDVFNEVLKYNSDSILMLIGKGPDEVFLRKKVEELKIVDKVMFLIDRDDVNELYQVMDIFVMPSLFEGLPLVAIEAQANGLPCVVSSNISNEVLLTNNIQSFDLTMGEKLWANRLSKISLKRDFNNLKILKDAGFDIANEAKKLEKIYIEMNDRKGESK